MTRHEGKFFSRLTGLTVGRVLLAALLLSLHSCAQSGFGPDDEAPDTGCGECPKYAHCDATQKRCVCDEGYELLGGRCVLGVDNPDGDEEETEMPDAPPDGDHDDEDNLADGDGEDDTPHGGNGDLDDEGEDAEGEGAENELLPACATPQAPALSPIHRDALLAFDQADAGKIEIGIGRTPDAAMPEYWQEADELALDSLGVFAVFARVVREDCAPQPFRFVYEVRDTYAPAAGQAGSTAIAKDDSRFKGWAVEVESVRYGQNASDTWRTPENALGPASGQASDVVSLGDGGQITLRFEPSMRNGAGPDFAVFENSFSDTFLELAFVEVSSDAVTFLRFDHVYLGTGPMAAFDTMDPTHISGFAGKYRAGHGTPFDLDDLANRQEVRDGHVDLDAIRYVRIVDVVGDGSERDSFGRAIYDPYPTVDSGGFDLDAVGVLNQ